MFVGVVPIRFRIGSGQHKDDGLLELWIIPDFLEKRQAVHTRHLQIQKDQTRTWNRRGNAFVTQLRQRFNAVAGTHDRVGDLGFAKGSCHGFGSDVVVLDQQKRDSVV